MRDQLAVAVDDLRLGEGGTPAAGDDLADGAEPPGVDRGRAQELHGQVERGVALARSEGRVDRAAGGGVEQTERNDLLKWGDDSRCGLLVNQGFNVGNYFFARKGNKIFCLLIAGICIQDAEELRAVLLPHLERLEGHKL